MKRYWIFCSPARSASKGIPCWRCGLAGVGSLALCFLLVLSLCRGSGEERESLPVFRRQLLPAEQLPQELKRVQEGVLHRLTVGEFDTLVERAGRPTLRKIPPRLLEARYHAVLHEEALIGDGQWKVRHKGTEPGLLELEPFSLALRHARYENGDALIAAFDGKTPALLVESAGEKTVSLDWSARGETGPEGVQFRLEVPSCPVAVLELDVPAGQTVSLLGASDDSLLLSGPHAAEKAELRRWKIVWRGREKIDFRIGRLDRDAARSATPFVVQKTTQKLHPEGLDATYELTLSGLTRGVRELVCECDPILRLRDVAGPQVDGCSFQTGGDDKPSRLTIRLREAVRAGTWQIVCLAPLSADPPGPARGLTWKSPGLHLVGGVPRGETLTLWLHPDLRVESWEPGQFRLTSISKSDAERAGAQNLTLVGGGLAAATSAANAPRRPEVRLQTHGVEFRARQWAWWHCDAAGMTLTAQIAWEVSQGQLFQLPVSLPPGWIVERVETSPAELLRDSRVRAVGKQSTLYVDLTTPLTPRSTGRAPALTIHLRPERAAPLAGRSLPFPDPVPLGARFREGALALDCDEQLFSLNVRTRAERSEPDAEGPWGQKLPEYFYRYRGQPLAGELTVQPRPPRVRARCASEVSIASGLAEIATRLRLEAESGSLDAVELLMSAGDGEPWQWVRTQAVRGEDAASGNLLRKAECLYPAEAADRLRVLAARDPLQTAVLLAACPTGERWRLTFAQPLRARESIRLQATRKLQARGNRWEVPLPVVLGAGRMEGEVTLHLAGGEWVQVQTLGLTESTSAAANGVTPWRTFRYGQSEVALTLSGQARAADRAAVATIDRARLITYVGDGGALQHHFSFQVANWERRTMPVRLPPGSRPLAVQVDGRWLPRLIPRLPAAESDEPEELVLPAPGREEALPGGTVHRYEIVYTRTLPAGLLWQKLDAPAPVLPVPSFAFRRVWRLPPKLTPLHDGRYQSVPGTRGACETSALPRRAADLFHLPGVGPEREPLLHDSSDGARAALARAVENLRGNRANQTLSLREVVSDLAFDHLKDRYCLIIDAVALRDAGINEDTRLTIAPPSPEDETPPWEACGLAAVAARSAILLTSAPGRGESISDSLEQALVAAAVQGQDPSGRFRSALDWLRPRGASAETAVSIPLPGLGSDRTEWSEWEPVAGLADDRLFVVRREAVTGLGFGLAVLLALVFWLVRHRSTRTRLMLLLLVLAVTGLSFFWLPSSLRDLAWWPLLAAVLGALAWYFKAVIQSKCVVRPPRSKSRGVAAGAATAGLMLLVVFGWNGRAATPPPVTVYVIPGPPEAPENQTVLVPADLLERLKKLGRPTPLVAGGPGAVLLDAAYDGKLAGNQAEFAAVFSVHCLSEKPVTLAIPLDGVQLLGEVWLDGARADPLALSAPQSGFSLKVGGLGRHKVELRFRVPVVGTAEDRNVLFTVPPLPRSRLTWHAPANGSETRVLVKRGAQWIARDGNGERLEADLGRLPSTEAGTLPRPVHLHWYQPAKANRKPRLQYQAAYLWDLNLEASYLTAWLRYRVLEGAVKSVEIDLPPELEARSASVRRVGPATKAMPAWLTHFRLRDWHLESAGGKRFVRLEFPYPIAGEFQAALELVPKGPLAAAATLPLPSPRGERSSKRPHFLAYRTQLGLNAQRETTRNITRIAENEFAPDWPGVPRLLPATADRAGGGVAYKISPDKLPVLRLQLSRAAPVVTAKLDVGVQAGAQMADVEIVADLKAPNRDLAAVEWDLRSPRLTIAAVTGDEVRAWKQSGTQVLVWLNRTTNAARLRLSGWIPLERRDGRNRLDLLGPHLVPARQQDTRLRLRAAADLSLIAVAGDNLQAATLPPGDRSANNRERSFQTSRPDYALRCEVQPAANAVARVLTLAEVNDRQLRFTTTVDYQIGHGELRRVRVRLKNWEHAEKVELQAEREALRRGPTRTAGGLAWQLSLKEGVTGRYRFTLRGAMPVEDAAVGVRMPEVTVQGVESAEYVLAVAGGELTAEARGHLAPVADAAKSLATWPGAAERVERTRGQVWQVRGSEWQLRLLPHARALEAAPVRVLLSEQAASVVDGQRWMHEARYWLRHEAHTDLTVDFPAPARVVSASIDGVASTPMQPGSSRLWLPLPGRAGVRCIRLRWLYDRAEPLERPNLTPPQLVDARKGTTLWTVRVPPGWDAPRGGAAARLGTGAPREAALALHRAEAQLRICQEWGRQGEDSAASAPLIAAQRRFALYCRHARRALEVGGNRGGVTALDGKTTLSIWLTKLEAGNRLLADQNGFDAVRVEAERRAALGGSLEGEASGDDEETPSLPAGQRCDSLSHGGTPISWQARGEAEPPVVQLIARESQRTRQALAASGQWLGVLLAIWILSFVPLLLPRLRLFWPEQIALLGIAGWYLAGPTLLVVFLLLAAAIGRIALLIRGLRFLFRRRKSSPSTMKPRNAPAT